MREARPYRTSSSNVEPRGNPKLSCFIAGLNRLAGHQLAARARGENQQCPLPVSDLAIFGLAWEDCQELASRGLVTAEHVGESTSFGPNYRILLTDDGAAMWSWRPMSSPAAGAVRYRYQSVHEL